MKRAEAYPETKGMLALKQLDNCGGRDGRVRTAAGHAKDKGGESYRLAVCDEILNLKKYLMMS